MDFPLLSDKGYNYLHESLQKIKNMHTQDEPQNYEDKENRACSSLCELSNNICLQDAKNQSGIEFYSKKAKQKQIGLSPWKNKYGDKDISFKQQKTRFFTKHTVPSIVQRVEFQRCRTENKENFEHQKAYSQNDNKLMKITSVLMRKTDKKPANYKPEYQEIEFIALMCKRKKYSVEIGECNLQKQKHKGNDTQSIIHKSFTPKILNLHHIEQENERISDKKLIKHTVLGCSEEMKDNIKNITLLNEHWKAKSIQSKSKKNKKVFLVRDTKSSQAREVKQNLLLSRKGSLSVEKQKRGEYKSNNPLTRLLYQKYLHTIGMSNPSKQLRTKYL